MVHKTLVAKMFYLRFKMSIRDLFPMLFIPVSRNSVMNNDNVVRIGPVRLL